MDDQCAGARYDVIGGLHATEYPGDVSQRRDLVCQGCLMGEETHTGSGHCLQCLSLGRERREGYSHMHTHTHMHTCIRTHSRRHLHRYNVFSHTLSNTAFKHCSENPHQCNASSLCLYCIHKVQICAKPQILAPRKNPGIEQTNLVCCAKSACFAPRSSLA